MNEKRLDATYWMLRLTYGLVPIVAGLDKFTNILVDWKKYIAPAALHALPVGPQAFMGAVGVIEIVAGLVVLSGLARFGGYLVAAWLAGIAANLALAGYYDVAVRDLVMAIGSVSLAFLAERREESRPAAPRVPATARPASAGATG